VRAQTHKAEAFEILSEGFTSPNMQSQQPDDQSSNMASAFQRRMEER